MYEHSLSDKLEELGTAIPVGYRHGSTQPEGEAAVTKTTENLLVEGT